MALPASPPSSLEQSQAVGNRGSGWHTELTAPLAIQPFAQAAPSRAISLVFNLCHQLCLRSEPRGQIQSGWELKFLKFPRASSESALGTAEVALREGPCGAGAVPTKRPHRGDGGAASPRGANPSGIPVCADAARRSNNTHGEYGLDATCRPRPESGGSAHFHWRAPVAFRGV